MALTGEAASAAELVGEVMVVAGRRRGAVDLADPGPGLRDQLVARWVVSRPRRAVDPAPTGEPGEVTGERDEIEAVVAGLDRLTRPQRAALLLSFRDRLTYAEIASILDRPVAAVGPAVAKAQTQLDASPYAIAAAFDQLSRAAPDPAEARAAAVRFARRLGIRRRRVSVLGGTAVVALTLAVALPTVVWPRLFPVPVRATGEWAYGYQVAAPAGFHISERFVERTRDSAYLVDDANPEQGCTIEAAVARPTPSVTPGGSAVKVNGRPGWITESDQTQDKTLSWSYAPQAVATVSCEDRTNPEPLLQQLAAGLTFAPVELSLPFRLSGLPEGYEVSAVGTSEQLSVGDPQPATGLLLAPIGAAENEEGGIFLLLPSDRPEDGGEDQEVLVNGTKAALRAGDGAITLCLPVQNVVACLSTSTSAARSEAKPPEPDVRRLIAVAESVSFAANLNDRTTWFDARDALPD